MLRTFAKPIPLALLLAFCTAIPILVAFSEVIQIPLGLLPEDSRRLLVAPVSLWLHALAGTTLGVVGPIQFIGVLRRRTGRVHRILGRVYGIAGLGLGLSAMSLLFHATSKSTPLLDIFRGLMGSALVVAILIGIGAAIARDLPRHRAWMIRSYAIGMGTATIALVMFPIYLIKGEPLYGLASDILFVSWWSLNIGLGEWVARKVQRGGKVSDAVRNQAAVA